MKETLKSWGRNLTKASMAVEAGAIVVATVIGSGGLLLLSAFGLGLDFVVLGKLNKEERNKLASSVSISSLSPRGSERFAYSAT